LFVMVKNQNTEKWHINRINASIQFENAKLKLDRKVVGKTYLLKNGPLPVVGEIRRDVLKMIRIEKVQHRFKTLHDFNIPQKNGINR